MLTAAPFAAQPNDREGVSMKEDILEQIVEEYLTHQGYFVRHNVKFKPAPGDDGFETHLHSNHSDIDVLAYHPTKTGSDKVLAVSCKSWQGGFNPKTILHAISHQKKIGGRLAHLSFRELTIPIWSEAFRRTVRTETGQDQFTYVTAVSRIKGSRECWENNPQFRYAMRDNPIRLLGFDEMIETIEPKLTTTLASTEIGRVIQIIRAAGLRIVPR